MVKYEERLFVIFSSGNIQVLFGGTANIQYVLSWVNSL